MERPFAVIAVPKFPPVFAAFPLYLQQEDPSKCRTFERKLCAIQFQRVTMTSHESFA